MTLKKYATFSKFVISGKIDNDGFLVGFVACDKNDVEISPEFKYAFDAIEWAETNIK